MKIGKIINSIPAKAGLFAAAIFAAAFSANANAQTAEARVYAQVGMVTVSSGADSRDTQVDANVAVDDLVAALSVLRDGHIGYLPVHLYFVRVEGGGTTAGSGISPGGLPEFGSGNEMQPGDTVLFLDIALNENFREFAYTVRIYRDGTDLFMARGEGEERPNVVAPRTAATLAAGEFFIDANNMTTTVLAAGLVGFNPPNCAEPTPNLATDMLSCEAASQTGNGGGGNDDGGTSATRPQTTGGGNDDNDHRFLGVVGGVVVAGILIHGLHSGFDALSFSHDVGYSFTESGYSYNVGARMDFRKDRWNLYWTAGQTNANGEFGDLRYESGGEYRTDFWTAAFSESVQGETAEYDFSLSADFRGGIWKVSPEFAVDSRYENGEFTTTNSFRISSEMRVDDWRFSVSGGTEQMQLFAVHRF